MSTHHLEPRQAAGYRVSPPRRHKEAPIAYGHPTNAHLKVEITSEGTKVSVVMNINGTLVEQSLAGVAGCSVILAPQGGFCDVRLAPCYVEILTDAGEEAPEADSEEAQSAAGRTH